MDLVIMMDDSREVKADEYAGAQQLLGSVVQQLAVSKQPRRADSQARVALVQQGTVHTAKPEFGLVSFQSNEPMRKHLLESMHQHGGSALLGQTLEFSLNQVLLKAGSARKKKVLLALVGSRTSAQDRAKLRHVSQRAKCAGVTVFVATVGNRYERLEVEELASTPLQQHLVHLGRLDANQQGYGRRFFRCFVSALNSESATIAHHVSDVHLIKIFSFGFTIHNSQQKSNRNMTVNHFAPLPPLAHYPHMTSLIRRLHVGGVAGSIIVESRKLA